MKRVARWIIFLLLVAGSNSYVWAQTQTQAGGDVRLSSDSTRMFLAPGAVGTRQVVLRNDGVRIIKGRMQPDLPEGWTMLIPPPAVTLEPDASQGQLISFQIPRATSAGSYEVQIRFSFEATYSSLDDSSAARESFSHSQSLRWQVNVTERFDVSVEWIEQTPVIRAGAKISGSLRITNSGNTTSLWRISSRSSLGYNVRSSPEIVELLEGESALVDVSVSSGRDISTRLDHALAVEIFSASDGEERPSKDDLKPSARLSMITEMIPGLNRGAISREGKLPASLTLSGVTEAGDQAGQVEFRIDETNVKDVLVTALIRTPDIRRTSSISSPDKYSLRLAKASWEILLGDQSYGLSDLLEPGTLGFGAGARGRKGKWTAGGFAQQSRKVFPARQQVGAVIGFKPVPTFSIEANALAKRQFEEGNLASFAAEYQPGSQYMRAEVAVGEFEGKTGRAAEAEVSLEKGPLSTSIQAETADRNFRGAIRSTEGLRGSATIRALTWLRIQGQYRGRRRFYDTTNGDATQSTTTARLGLTATMNRDRFRAYVTMTGENQRNTNTLTQLNRELLSAQLRFGFNKRRLGMNGSVERGQSQDPLSPSLSPFHRITSSIFGSRRSLSFNVSGSWLEGPTFYNPIDQKRLSVGLNLGWEPGELTKMTLGAFRSAELLRDDQTFTMIDARIARQFQHGHEVSIRSRITQTSFDNTIKNATIAVAWSIPLFLPIPGMESSFSGRLAGQVVDMETGLAIEGAIVRVDGMEAISDVDGHWELQTGDSPVVYLSIDRQSIGFDRRPVGTFPMSVELAAVPETGFEINVVRSGSFVVQMALDESTGQRKDAALNDALTPSSLAGILIEIRSGSDRLRRLTDRDGRAQFADLVPGSWSVFALGNSLPPESETKPDTLQVELLPSASSEVKLLLRKRTRQIRIVGSGGAVIEGLPTESTKRAVITREEARPITSSEQANASLPLEHTVQSGETLSSLARRYYGSTAHWVRLWLANQTSIGTRDLLLPGMVLTIPPAGRLTDREKRVILDFELRRE